MILGHLDSTSELWKRITFSFNILLAQTASVPKSSRLLLFAWLLVGVRLSNEYHGENITQFVSQLPPKPLDDLRTLIDMNFGFCSSPLQAIRDMYKSVIGTDYLIDLIIDEGLLLKAYGTHFPSVVDRFLDFDGFLNAKYHSALAKALIRMRPIFKR